MAIRAISAAAVSLLLLTVAPMAEGQDAPAPNPWTYKWRLELRGNYRDSREQRLPLKFPFPPSFLPVGQTVGFEETVDAGTHAELSVAQVRLDLGYGKWLAAHTQIHVQDKYRRNPTSNDRKIDADELWLRFGEKPEMLDRPEKTSFFLQLGKAPKMERQPIRLLESYGLAATSFNRFEDVQAMLGGTIGRNFYWRAVGSSGNPLYFRDPNALAGDNGIPDLLTLNPDPYFKSGFPILYNTETEGYFLKTEHFQFGQGLGYRWQNEAGTAGFDAIAFHYRRTLAQEQKLTGTFYGSDIDLLDGPQGAGVGIPTHGRLKEETGGRIYAEWRDLTVIGQYTKQNVAGLHREGFELESGYRIPFSFGPSVGGESLFQYLQPAARLSGLQNRFKGPPQYPAPSVWWNWIKFDLGVRIGLAKNVDITAEHSRHNIVAARRIEPSETLVTVRVRI
jgi:hypothetical protein